MLMSKKRLDNDKEKQGLGNLLIYDQIWWIQGQRAQIIKKYYPELHIMSYHDMVDLVKQQGADHVNQAYDVIATLGLWTAERLLKLNVSIDSAIAGSYSYFAKNQDEFKEWCEEIIPDPIYFSKVINQISRIGAVNPKIAKTIESYSPEQSVTYLKSFIEADIFKPQPSPLVNNHPFTIGWVGNTNKKSKNYLTLYKTICEHFKGRQDIQFKEATREARIDRNDMPSFYQSLHLLLITGANEGLPNPAMEAYSSGLPVLSTNIGIVKEWASPLAKSLIIDSDEPQLFINKIEELVANRQLLIEMSQEIRPHILRNWSIEKNIGQWITTLFGIEVSI